MSDPTIDEDLSHVRISPRRRALGWLGAVGLLLVVLVLFVHVLAPAIGSDEVAPSGHPQSGCIACHIMTGSSGDGVDQ